VKVGGIAITRCAEGALIAPSRVITWSWLNLNVIIGTCKMPFRGWSMGRMQYTQSSSSGPPISIRLQGNPAGSCLQLSLSAQHGKGVAVRA